MIKKTIVMTTINPPTKAFGKFIQKPGWDVIVVGDKKTPHEAYAKLPEHVIYMHPDQQDALYPELSAVLGWNTIERRNIGFIEAWKRGADVMATVDDDNVPYDHVWGSNLLVGKEVEVNCYEPENEVFDPFSATNYKRLWHRGYPAELVPTKNRIKYLGKIKRRVLVQADFWDGDPDIDAAARIYFRPQVAFSSAAFPFCSNKTSPFDSQNTFVHRDVIPHYMMFTNVGRMDDIWSSYLIQEVFPNSVIYSRSSVFQERNAQSLMKNLHDEMIGIEHTLDFIRGKYELPQSTKNAYECYKRCFA